MVHRICRFGLRMAQDQWAMPDSSTASARRREPPRERTHPSATTKLCRRARTVALITTESLIISERSSAQGSGVLANPALMSGSTARPERRLSLVSSPHRVDNQPDKGTTVDFAGALVFSPGWPECGICARPVESTPGTLGVWDVSGCSWLRVLCLFLSPFPRWRR